MSVFSNATARKRYAEEPAVHRLNQLVGPGYRSHASAGLAIEGKTGFLKDVQPLHVFMAVCGRQASETQGNEAIHGHFQALVELSMNALDTQDLRDFAPCESYGFCEVVLEREHAKGNEDIEVLLGWQPEFGIALYLP
jgi:hypothetical protein